MIKINNMKYVKIVGSIGVCYGRVLWDGAFSVLGLKC